MARQVRSEPDAAHDLGGATHGVADEELLDAAVAGDGIDVEDAVDTTLAVRERRPRCAPVGDHVPVVLDEGTVAGKLGLVEVAVVVVHVGDGAELRVAVEGTHGGGDAGHGGMVLRAAIGPEDEGRRGGQGIHLSPPA